MEIKLACACGTKFKFEVEPVHGRMPAPVSCPECSADCTELANDLIREQTAAAPTPAAVPAASSVPASLHIRRVTPSTPSPQAAEPQPELPPAPRTPAFMPPVVVEEEPKSKGPLAAIIVAVVVLAIIAVGVWKMGGRWYQNWKDVVEVASMSEDSFPNVQVNLWYEDATVLFIKHTDHLQVAEACKVYWKEKLRKNLTILGDGEMEEDKGEYQVIPAYNGYVRLMGGLEWPEAEFEGLSQHLSQKLNTLIFETREVDFSGEYHFGVYEKGMRKFHIKNSFKAVGNELEETVTVENKEWAIANGYKPGPDGFDEFHLGDADDITQRLGMKLWDEPEGEWKGLLLKEIP